MKEYIKFFSSALGRDMEVNRYGHSGVPLIGFPSERGRFYDLEDQGMIQSIQYWIDNGLAQVFAVDTVDHESWSDKGGDPYHRARRQQAYDAYIADELLPFVSFQVDPSLRKPITFGVSMGGYHAGNSFFRHPDKLSGTISLSGVFDLRDFIGDYNDDVVHQQVPIRYLALEEDSERLGAMRRGDCIICMGTGDYEDEMRRDADAMEWILRLKGIPAWIDRWGSDVNHDWPWWRVQLPYFLSQLQLR